MNANKFELIKSTQKIKKGEVVAAVKNLQKKSGYRKFLKETRGSYFFSEGPNAGVIKILPILPIVF